MSGDLDRPSKDDVDKMLELFHMRRPTGRAVITIPGKVMSLDDEDSGISIEKLQQLEKKLKDISIEKPDHYLVMSQGTVDRINHQISYKIKEDDIVGSGIVKINNYLSINSIIKLPFSVNLA